MSSWRSPHRSTTGHFVRLFVIITEKSVYKERLLEMHFA